MKFDEILDTLRDNGKSGQAYAITTKIATQAMLDDPTRGVGYYLLVALSNRFIESTGRLPITTVQTDNAYENFASHVAALNSAYSSSDDSLIIEALNQVAQGTLEPFDSTFPAV